MILFVWVTRVTRRAVGCEIVDYTASLVNSETKCSVCVVRSTSSERQWIGLMVRLFVPFPSLAFTPHRDRCLIIAVNDAGDTECGDLLFFFLISAISPIFWGVVTVLPLSALVPALVEPLFPFWSDAGHDVPLM